VNIEKGYGMTVRGKLLAGQLAQYIGYTGAITATCSLIARHSKSLETIAVRVCNDAFADQDALDRKWDRLVSRITELVAELPESDGGAIKAEIQGDPRGYIVKLIVVDANGIPRTFGVE
jgi:hypothetical protein